MDSRTIHPRGVELLIQGIVTQARLDYMSSKPFSVERQEVERFFRSRHFALLTGQDGRVVLKHLEKQYQKKHPHAKDGD